MLERVEERLLSRVEEPPAAARFSWPVTALFGHRLAKIGAVVALVAVSVITGVVFFTTAPSSSPTYVYQAGGVDAGQVGRVDSRVRRVTSHEGGAVRLANRHGYVQLRDGAGLSLARVGKRTARYELEVGAPDKAGADGGSATFFVTPRRRGGSFVLTTTAYDIVVTGTYFRVVPGAGNRPCTRVLEGSVEIRGADGHDYFLTAGQSLVFDSLRRGYRVEEGGPVVSRGEVARMPDLASIDEHHILVVTSNVPSANVTIDGIERGTTPLRILLPDGRHHLRLEREHYHALDTTVEVGREETARLYALLMEQPREFAPARPRAPKAPRVASKPVTPAVTEPVDEEPSVEAPWRRLLERAAQAEQHDWRRAVALYERLVEREDISALARQTALFAIGRLWAEYGKDTHAAQKAFRRYLALYPHGTFTRESLLRLAEIAFESDQDEAIDYYLTYFEKYPNHYRVPELRYRVGLVYLQKKRPDKAAGMFRQSLAGLSRRHGDLRSRVYTGLHKALVATGDTTGARHIERTYLSAESN
jgi:tetratricopeptide (TPR) repeat protein